MSYIHYPTLGGPKCGLSGEALVTSANWDRVTCPECLKKRGEPGCGTAIIVGIVVVVLLAVISALVGVVC